MVNKGPFLEPLHFKITESGANTFTEEEIATPASKTETMAMIIHKIEVDFDNPDDPAQNDRQRLQITNASVSEIKRKGDTTVLYKFERSFEVLTSGGGWFNLQDVHQYPGKGFIYPKSKIFVSCQSAGQTAAQTYTGIIWYTLEKIDRDAFIAGLTE